MQKKVLLYNDNTKRDLLGIKLLEQEFQRRGFKTRLCNPDNVKVVFRGFKPDAFIAARGDHFEAKEAAKCCKVFIVPGEGAQQTKETILSVFMGRGYWKLDNVDFIERCYLWGHDTKDWILESGLFHSDQLVVTGNTRLDIYRFKDVLQRLSKRDTKDFVLGVAFSSKSTSTYYGKPEYAKMYFKMHSEMSFPITASGRHFEDIAWRDHAILRLMMRYLKAFLTKCEGKVLLRPSPFEDPGEFAFLEKEFKGRVIVDNEQTLPEFLCQMDCLLTCWSTTGLEALILDKPVISIANTMDQDHLFNHISRRASGFETFVPYYHLPKTEDEVIQLIKSAAEERLPASPRPKEEVQALLKKLYDWPGEASSCARIAEDVETVLSAVPVDDNSPAKWDRAFKMRWNLPMPLVSLLLYTKAWMTYFRSGAFKNYYGFRRLDDKNILRIARLAFKLRS